ncbi:MAG: hypothetical protein DRP66_03040 [Planctomycetota bacterium]|nr:MAG: hypothetical protein DRP66_03040 [Planctomycetota bacterium]
MQNRTTYVFIVICTIGILFLAISGTATARKANPVYTEMTGVVKRALVRQLGTSPKITSVRGQISPEYGSKYSYDEGSIGRKLTADEWRESQAWQALAGYNTAKQARHHDIDSMVWCTLRGGGNSGTYMKPLIDFNDHMKLAFYAYKSTLQKYYAAGKGVDVVYGPGDKITPVIIALGERRVVDLTIQCINEQGKVASTKKFTGVKIPSGRPIVELEAFRPDIKSQGHYGVTFVVTEKGKVLGRTFELKYFSNNASADGDTDFIGGTSVFNTDQRVEFLSQYAKQARRFFKDPNLDKKVVTDAEVAEALKKIKPQPLPEVRRRQVLNSGWKHLAYRNGETSADTKRLASWSAGGASIEDEQLVITRDNANILRTFDAQDWRFFLQWKVIPVAGKTAKFTLAGSRTSILTINIDAAGNVTAAGADAGRIKPGTAGELKVEVDLQYNQFSLYVNGKRTIYAGAVGAVHEVSSFSISGGTGLVVDDIRGTGYDPAEDIRTGIFDISTFIDEDFAVTPAVDSWQSVSYDDGKWATDGELPIVVGSERNKGRDIYLRRTVDVGQFKQAFLNVDALDPGGEIFINGKKVAKLNRRPVRLDVTGFLNKGANLIAVKVDHVADGFYTADGHTSKDLYYGWFAGRMSLDLTSAVYVDDVFVYTEKLGDPATVKVTVEVSNKSAAAFDGEAVIRLFPWCPAESATASVVDRVAVKLDAAKTATISKSVSVPNPLLWDYEHPNLYKVAVTLLDESGKAQDDYVVTTGIRTISEEGGTFRINGKEEVLNGATWMQFLAPFDKSTTWHRCSPKPWIVKGILMIRAMEGNTLRKHEPSGAYSDPRFAEIGDQLGIMYIWVPTGWTRKHWTNENKNPDGSKMPLDKSVEEYTVDIRQVRNSPSIVMWEIFNESVDKKDRDSLFEAFYPAIYKTDPSRFIMPLKGYYRDEPMVVKGVQIGTLGYARKWKALRDKPLGGIGKYEKSSKYGMYAVEFAEVAGQDNWDLVKCKPWYKVHSYEWGPVVFKIECSVDGKDMELLITEEGRIISRK